MGLKLAEPSEPLPLMMFKITVKTMDARTYTQHYEAIDAIAALLMFKEADVVMDEEIHILTIERIPHG